MRTYNERKQFTERKVKRRVDIVNGWTDGMDIPHPLLETTGKMKKYNLSCGCGLCKHHKHVGNSKDKFSHSDLKKSHK